MEAFTIPLLFFFSFFSIFVVSNSLDTISKNQLVTDGNGKTIVSSNESFELGFFSPGNSKNRYVGIWYKKISTRTVVWVANREAPLADKSGVLRVIDPGNLVLLNGTNHTIWSTNASRSVQNPVVRLLDSGNLVVKDPNDENPENFLWQSFDYPAETFLPGMKLGKSLITGREWYVTSWKTNDDPGRGQYKYWFDLRGYPQTFISNGSVEVFRFGSWNGLRFTGAPSMRQNPFYSFKTYFGKDEVYYMNGNLNGSFSRFTVDPTGVAQRWIWVENTRSWNMYRSIPTDNCDTYKLCGAYGSCNIDDSPVCSCLRKFVPKYQRNWDLNDWTSGCVRRTPTNCTKGDGFVQYSSVKLPDTRNSRYNASMTSQECKEACLKNCSCMAYTTLNISSGSGCLFWFDDLVDIRVFTQNGQDIFIRMASSDLDEDSSSSKKRTIILVTIALFAGIVLLVVCILLCVQKKKKKKSSRLKLDGMSLYSAKRRSANQEEDIDLPLFDFTTIANATNEFSDNNKLGEGGFGPVYKGTLAEGREIAVKRLSKNSRQGLHEFKNEVVYIAKLQHRNLVKLLGCCFQDDEMMLVYEYLPNKSLDRFIFDQNCSKLLDWRKRINIINGIARGLLYLHQDSRLRIVHRDLKAENVLLDNEMNAKISDFGLARSFGGNETEANTNKVVGTHGYISPEYAVNGLYSVKSDVFSFGVLVLEIISGRRNRGFNHPEHGNLLGHAWQMYLEGRTWELIDGPMKDSWNASELLRTVNIGLLCVQQRPEDRPSMSAVVLMLGGEGSTPRPKQPGFFEGKNRKDTESSSSHIADSGNELTITQLQPR